MSVINSVLKDLDQRPTVFTPLGAEAAVGDEVATTRSIMTRTLLALLLILGAGMVWMLWQDRTVADSVGQPVIAATPAPTVDQPVYAANLSADGSELSPDGESLGPPVLQDIGQNRISGLHIRESRTHMELEFQLAYATSIFLKQRSSNRYVFTLQDVSSLVTTPVISDNPWIRQIAIAPLRDDLEVRFDTRPGVLVDTEEKRQGEAFYWLVRLKKSLAAASDPVPAAQVGLTRRSAEKPDVQAPLSAPRDKGLGVASAQSAVSASNQPASVDAQRQPATRVKPVRLQISQVDAPDRTRDQLRQALDTIKQGDSVGGIELLDQLLGSDIDRDVRIHKLRVYQRLNQVVAFNRLLNESLRLYPADPVFGLYRANSLFAAQRYADLVQQFADEQEQYELVSLVATSQQRLGQHDAAVEGFKRTLEVNPAQPRFWISLAISQQHLGQTRQALGSYQMALRSGPLTQKLRAFAVEKIRQLSD